MEYRLLNLNKIEQLTGITFKTIKKRLQDSAVKPIKVEGTSVLYDAREVFPALYSTHNQSEASDLSTERAKLARAQAEKIEIETEKLLGTLIDKETWCSEWSAMLVEFKDRLLAAPLKLVSLLQGKDTGEMYEIISNHLKEILNELAEESKAKADEIEFELSQS